MNILVFGKDGQLGKAFNALFNQLPKAANVQVTYLGRAECDLANVAEVQSQLRQSKPDIIINASAYTAVDKAESEIDLAFAVNARAPEFMARYARENNATLLHFSTDYVFDGHKNGWYVESDERNPLSIYGKSKAAGEVAIENVFINATTGQFAIFRASWVYGDGSNFIRTILRLAKEREELKVIDDQHGVPTPAKWLAQIGLDLILDSQWNLKKIDSGIYHAIPAGETSWYGLACLAVQAALDAGITLKASSDAVKPIQAVEYPLLAPRPMNSRMDSSKLRSALQNQASYVSNSYNEFQNMSNFPAWDGMVQEYVAQLAADGLI